MRAQTRPVGTVSRGVQHCLGGDVELTGLHLSPQPPGCRLRRQLLPIWPWPSATSSVQRVVVQRLLVIWRGPQGRRPRITGGRAG
ncbi:hypothetical protein A4G28_19650 [Mycobacterium ostraviense]|uniref:Uncharacterized protein n=1 Tax=Mycobacterium ostraviense TaxID=2738409 RepID=A0A164ED45_9MYCO|nr:hypothetical protein A4G28_19650 [Mycobacterium ostraviense]